MKALPLWQPWATLVACGAKRVETRSWPAPIPVLGERIAIHATKGGLSQAEMFRVLSLPVFAEALRGALELGADTTAAGISRALPRGAIVATARLARSAPITVERAFELQRRNPAEYAFGDYTPGRYAWVLEDVEQLAVPILCRGHQGIFRVPEDVGQRLGDQERGQEALFT